MSPPTSLGMCLSGQGIALIFVASTEQVSCGGFRTDEPENHTALPWLRDPPQPRTPPQSNDSTPAQGSTPAQVSIIAQDSTPAQVCPLQHRVPPQSSGSTPVWAPPQPRIPPQSSGSTPTQGSTPVWDSTLVGRLYFYAFVFLPVRWYIWRSEVLQNQLEQLEIVHDGK